MILDGEWRQARKEIRLFRTDICISERPPRIRFHNPVTRPLLIHYGKESQHPVAGLREAKEKMARTGDGKTWEKEEGEGSYTEPEDSETRGVNDSQFSLHGFRHLSNSHHITTAMWQA